MQSALSRIWTQVANSISYDCYTTFAFMGERISRWKIINGSIIKEITEKILIPIRVIYNRGRKNMTGGNQCFRRKEWKKGGRENKNQSWINHIHSWK